MGFERAVSTTYPAPAPTLQPMGRPKVYGERRATAVRLPPALHQRLREAAAERQVSANLLVEQAIAEYLERLVPVEHLVGATP